MLDIVCGSMVQFQRDRDGKMVELSKPLACHLPSVMLMRTDVFRMVGPFSGKWRVGETIEWVSRAVDAGVRRGSIADVVLLRRVHEQNLGKVVSASSHEYLQMLREVMVRAGFQLDLLDVAQTKKVQAVTTPTDGHELRLLSDGSHLLFTYSLVPHTNLTGLSTFGKDETMVDCSIQRVDPAGKVTWTWSAADHIDPITETLDPLTTSTGEIDVFHCNSIDVDSIGNMLVSLRETNAVYYIDHLTGTIQWKLGGSPTNKDGAAWIQIVNDPQVGFSEQHDARFAPNGHVTLFDDHCGVQTGVARGVDYYVDVSNKKATFSWQYLGTGQSKYEGSFRRYSDGESVIGWGYNPKDTRVLTEVDAQGQDIFDVSLGGEVSYRAIKVPKSELDPSLLRASAGK